MDKWNTDEKKNKIPYNILPNTQRCEPGSNWDTYKNLLSEVSHPNVNSKNETLKKTRYRRTQKYKRTIYNSTTTMNSVAHENIEDGNFDIGRWNENKTKLTKHIAMDCEMVGIGDGSESMIARVSIVNQYGYCLYDKYVKPKERVKDYRTPVSGIRAHHLRDGEEFAVVQKEIAEMLKGRILVGHALKNDLAVLYLSHPRRHLRDTSRYEPFRQVSKGRTPSLKKLAQELLGKEIQVGEHSSVEDARATMQLYMLYKKKWESEIYSK